SLPVSSLIWADRSSHWTESNGSASSVGQNWASIFRPLDNSRRPSILECRALASARAESGRERGAVTVAIRQLLAAKRGPRNRGPSFLLQQTNSDQMSGSRAASLGEFPPSSHNIRQVRRGSEKPSTYHILYVRHLLLQPVVGATVYRVTKRSQQSAVV